MKKIPAVQSFLILILFISVLSAGHAWAQAWSAMASGTSQDLYDIWGSSDSDVFAIGASGTIRHYDGTAWSGMESGMTCRLKKIVGISATEVFALCDDNTIIKYDGTAWAPKSFPMPKEALSDIWGLSTSNVFAVGAGGAIERFQFLFWIAMNSGTDEDLCKVWGTSKDDVFAIGTSGTIVHYNGNRGKNWSVMPSGTAEDLNGIRGKAADNAFAVGNGGTILHYNGWSWLSMVSGTTTDLANIWLNSVNQAFAVGNGGEILYYNGAFWSAMTSNTSADLHKVWGLDEGALFVVGDSGTILHCSDLPEPTTSVRTTVPTSTTTIGSPVTTTIASTSSSIAASTIATTSTSTTTSIHRCIFRRSSAGRENLQSLRELRNQNLHTASGALLASLYYQNMDEIAAIVQNDSDLRARFMKIFSKNLPALRQLARQGSAAITSEGCLEIYDFLKDLQARAGPKLGMHIALILRSFESGWLFSWLGITVEQG